MAGVSRVTLCAIVCGSLVLVRALDNGVGRTPAMGWNSWNAFRCNISEALIREVADAMVSSGLREAGYQYVNIDDCWQEKRGADGRIVPFASKFPSGMKALADYVHSKGLKFGVYSDTGNHTCEGYPGSWGHEELDAKTYAEWGVDYLKYDYCDMGGSQVSVQESYTIMRDALNKTGRPILFSLCSWGTGEPHKWGASVGNSWRTSIDVFAAWDEAHSKSLKLPSFLQSVLSSLHNEQAFAEYAGPGGFNDPDMLVVGLDGMYPYGIVQDCPEHVKSCKPGDYISREQWGRVGGLTQTEQRTHFTFWAMLSAPLILGNDPRHMSKATVGILTAPEVLAISQDPKGHQARKISSEGHVEKWLKDLADGTVALLVFNGGATAVSVAVDWKHDLPELSAKWERDVPAPVRDCRDSVPECRDWAKAGECEKNEGFMNVKCKASCPKACPPPPEGASGPRATALVRDAWMQQDLGVFTAGFVAHLVEPHEGRLLKLTFGERDVLVKQLEASASAGGGGGASATSSSGGDKLAVGALGRRGALDAGAAGGTADLAEMKLIKHQAAQLAADLERSKGEVVKLGEQMRQSHQQTVVAVAKAAALEKVVMQQQEELLRSRQQHPPPGLITPADAEAGLDAALEEEAQQEQLELARIGRRRGTNLSAQERGLRTGDGAARAAAGRPAGGVPWGFVLGCVAGAGVVGVVGAILTGSAQRGAPRARGRTERAE